MLENNLNALVIEGLPLATRRNPREKARVRQLAQPGRRAFLFLRPGDALNELVARENCGAELILDQAEGNSSNEHFLVIADARFSALLATVHETVNDPAGGDEVIWSFEPDVVYSALEYLMARVRAEHPYQANSFGAAVRTSMPKATSLQLTLSVTTKLAHLLQEQAAREIAVNRIATAIRESLELGIILQKTVDEVGAALKIDCCALRVEGPTSDEALRYFYFARDSETGVLDRNAIAESLDSYCQRLMNEPEVIVNDGGDEFASKPETLPTAIVPLTLHERSIGGLQVTTVDSGRVWNENEILLLRTVAAQVAVAVNHASLFAQIQQQALTDALTGCYNRRSFEMQLDKDLQMAGRLHQPLSLLMLDLDRFKQLNDSVGHDAGDDALRRLADCFRQELRGVDSAARFGGDEFALILPQAYSDGAMVVAERLRERIEQIKIPGFGNVTASIGIATFPLHATVRAELVSAADAALYSAKRSGRNRVCIFNAESDERKIIHAAPEITIETTEQTM